jgi:hypothetical protein
MTHVASNRTSGLARTADAPYDALIFTSHRTSEAVLRDELRGGEAAAAPAFEALTPARFKSGIAGSHARDRAPAARRGQRRRLTQRFVRRDQPAESKG